MTTPMTENSASEAVTFKFDWARRQNAIEVTQKLLAGLRDRVLPVFTQAEEADRRYVDRTYEKLSEEKEDGSQPTEEELNEALELYDESLEPDDARAHEFHWLGDHLLLMSLVGLYHQWERTVKRFLADEFQRNGFSEDWRSRTLRADFSLLKKWIEALGFPPAQAQVLGELHSLLLIVNVAKHGDGDACQKLAKKHPDFFWHAPDEAAGESRAERLRIAPQNLEQFALGIVKFWQSFPQHGTVGVRTLREPVLAHR
jgi:hypothetical protein